MATTKKKHQTSKEGDNPGDREEENHWPVLEVREEG